MVKSQRQLSLHVWRSEDRIDSGMRFSSRRYGALLQSVYSATDAIDKGKSLEDLIAYLMGLIPGVRVIDRNVNCGDEELDVVLWNDQTHPTLRPWESIILIECKNWSGHVGSMEISWFLRKMEERGMMNGIFVAINGVTGDFNRGARRQILNFLAKKIRVIVITGTDLQTLNSRASLCEIIRDKYCQLFLGKV